MVALEIDVYGDVQFSRRLMRWADAAEDMRPVFRKLEDDFHNIEAQQFRTQGGRSGGWAPISASYRRWKVRHGLSPRILHATFALRDSLIHKGARGSVSRITHDELFVGTNVRSPKGFPYAAVHQNPQRGQIRRRPVEFRPADRTRWVKMLQAYLVENST